jgi:hypothetical protein
MSTNANYNGRVGNNTTNTRYFTPGMPYNLWTTTSNTTTSVSPNVTETVLTPSSTNYSSVYIPGNLVVDGTITNPSDLSLKENIVEISAELSDTVMRLKPSQFTYKSDTQHQVHYGFIAQEFEQHFPELVSNKPTSNINYNPSINKHLETNIKAINYLEVLPLLVHKIQNMQKEIDELRATVNSKQ